MAKPPLQAGAKSVFVLDEMDDRVKLVDMLDGASEHSSGAPSIRRAAGPYQIDYQARGEETRAGPQARDPGRGRRGLCTDTEVVCAPQFDGTTSRRNKVSRRKALRGLLRATKPRPEFAKLLEALRKPLPITFRIFDATRDGTCARLEAEAVKLGATRLQAKGRGPLRAKLERELRAQGDKTRDGALRDFLVRGDRFRCLRRQEEVSMASVEALDPRPNDVVLDCCAAPGSKTTQLVERCEGGCVVAVEYDAKRARRSSRAPYTFVAETERRGSSSARATPRSCRRRNVLIGSSATCRARRRRAAQDRDASLS